MKRAEKMPAHDWHPFDIKAALAKAGWSFNQLGLAHGYTSKSSLTAALRQPWPKAERLIAGAIGVTPQVIWPSRYNADGTPNRVGGPRPMRPKQALPLASGAGNDQVTTPPKGGNPQLQAGG